MNLMLSRNSAFVLNLLMLTLCYSSGNLFAQGDPQYTQYYANSLYLNPAFAGSTECSRAFVIGRLQWLGIQGSRTTGTASFDHYFDKYRSGVGAIVTKDYIPASGLSYTDIALQYAYQLEISEGLTFRPGVQVGMGKRGIDYNRLDFGAQYTDRTGLNKKIDNGENFVSSTIPFYADVAAGGLLYSKNTWVGIAAHHMNRPRQQFNDGSSNNLEMKTSLHAGVKILMEEKRRPRYGVIQGEDEKSISPTFMYKMQGKWDQLDVGLYGRYNALVVGFWYRGLPIKVYKTERSNNDALNLLVGFVYDKVNVGYSYDMTISKLGAKSGGSHELSLTYTWCAIGYPKKKIKRRRVVCPKF